MEKCPRCQTGLLLVADERTTSGEYTELEQIYCVACGYRTDLIMEFNRNFPVRNPRDVQPRFNKLSSIGRTT